MPLYKYECQCGAQRSIEMTIVEYEQSKNQPPTLHPHGEAPWGTFERVFDFHFARGMTEHYSHTLDRYVTSDRAFNDEVKRQSDEMSARMGYDVVYETIDPNDAKAAGVKGDVGLESQERAHHALNSDGHKTTFS